MNTSIPAGGPSGEGSADRLARYMPVGEDEHDPNEPYLTYTDIRGMFWRQRRLLLLVVLGALLLGAGVTFLMTKRYAAVAAVRIDNSSLNIVEGQNVDPVIGNTETNRYLKTQELVVESRSMALKVAQNLGLAKDDTFLKEMHASPPDDTLAPSDKAAARLSLVADVLQANVTMDVPTDNRIASLKFESPSPSLAAKVANAYADAYLADNVQKGYQANAYARKILRDQVTQAQAQLRDTELNAIAYARNNRLIGTGDITASNDSSDSDSTPSAGTITTADLVQVNQAFVQARNARILAEQRWRNAQTGNPRDLPEARDNSALQQLMTSRAAKTAELADLRERYLPDHPKVLQAQAAIADLDQRINEMTTSIRNSIRNEYEIAKKQEAELSKLRDELAGQTLQEQDRRVQLNLISRDAQVQRDQLEELQKRLNQLDSAADISANNITLLDRAIVPSAPVSPDLKRNLLIALIAGLGLAIGLALLRETLDDTLHSPEDAERKLGLPLIGATPLVADPVGSGDAEGELSEAYYSIRAALDYASAGKTHKVFLVTSSQAGEGKSTTSLALARDFARIGRRVLLVDADLRKPSLHKVLNLPNRHGFIDVLTRKAGIAEVLLPEGTANLDLLGLGPVPPNPAQLLSSELLTEFVEKARRSYDIVIMDSAPVMGLADAPMIALAADFTVLIVEAGRAHFGQAKSAIRRLKDGGANLLGIVITKFDYRDAGYSYDYLYSYYGEHEGKAHKKPSFAQRVFGSG